MVSLVSAGLAITGLMLTLSRGALVGGAVSLLVLLAWPRFRRYAFALLTVLALFALVNLNSLQATSTVSLVGQRIATLTTSEGQRGGRRIDIWSDTPGIVIDHPFLGVGEGNYPNTSPDYGIRDIGGLPFDHAHNLALTIAAETGLIGLTLFAGFAVSVGRVGTEALRGRSPGIYPPALAVIAALTGLLVTSLGEYPPRTNVVMALILIEVGALVGYNRLHREQVGGGHVL
jgi:O-antigen ligase